ncbi:MAG: tetratricopeptide repeat protein, partial [Bacteroidetes bacterium]|nr:tetratricopeptide repeat protein [Bacteroidota bacterium]
MMRPSIILLLLTFWLTAQGQRDRRLDEIDSLIANEDYTTAIQRIDLKRPSADERTLGLLASRTASILILQGNLDAAETVLKPHLNSSDPFTEAVTRTRMGFLHLNKARNDLALEDLQNSLELFEKAGQSKSPEAATCLTYLSLVYLSSGKINQALENALVTLNLHEQLYGENTEETAAAYNDLGLVYSGINPDLALEYYEKALAIYEKVHGKNHRKIAIALTNIGIMYRQMKLYGDAINDFESAEAIWKKIYPNGHPNQALALLNLGITYGQMGDRNAALGYYQKALVIYRNSYGTKHSDIANVLNQIGLLKLTQNRYGEALRSYQQALISNAPGFNDTTLTANPGSRDYYNGKVLLFSLRLKAEALEALHYGRTLRFRDLE